MQRASLVILVVCAVSVHAQIAPRVAVPISKEAHHHLVLENEYVRVYSVEVAPHSETLYHQHDLDYIFVTLGDSDVDSVRVGEKPVRLQLKDGEVRFTKGGFAHKAVNNSDKPFRNVTVELKQPSSDMGEHTPTEPVRFGSGYHYTSETLIQRDRFQLVRAAVLEKGEVLALGELSKLARTRGLLVVTQYDGLFVVRPSDAAPGAGGEGPILRIKKGEVIWVPRSDAFRYHFMGSRPGSVKIIAIQFWDSD